MNVCSLFFATALFFSSISLLHADPVSNALVENITTEEYCAFLNAVETTGAHGFYHPETSAGTPITYSLAEDGVHFTYSIVNGCEEFFDISPRDFVCYSNWLYHDCPTGDAVTDEVLYTPIDPTTYHTAAPFRIAPPTSTSAPACATSPLPSPRQNPKPQTSSYSSYFYDGLKVIASVTEWTALNVGGEVVEAIVFQQLGLYALIPYCAYMGAVILHEYTSGEYYEAAGTILHAFFDIACMLGGRIGFDVAGILGNCLEQCGLKCVADFFGTIHEQIDWLLHRLNIEHAHGFVVEEELADPLLRQEIADGLQEFSKAATSSPSSIKIGEPTVSNSNSKVIPGAGWANFKCRDPKCTEKHP